MLRCLILFNIRDEISPPVTLLWSVIYPLGPNIGAVRLGSRVGEWDDVMGVLSFRKFVKGIKTPKVVSCQGLQSLFNYILTNI